MEEQEVFLLRQAVGEIQSLRRENELMRARLEMFDAVMSVLHSSPAIRGNGLMSPDIVYEINKFLSKES